MDINANKLTIKFDPKKSSYCIFKPRNKCLPVNFNRGLTMGAKVLKYKENTRYLGLLLDNKLTWDSHIQELNKKLVKYTGILSKIRYCLPLIVPTYSIQCFYLIQTQLWVRSLRKYRSEIHTTTNHNTK